jgi:asparagine synthase (glutamine-hydrolysing)
MCGIAAVCAANAQQRTELLSRLLQGLAHRGLPECQDESDDIPACRVGLGTNRLAIVAPEAGRQPVTAPHGRYRLIFNGEVFNHRALAAQLWGAGGYTCQPPFSDTAVLAAAIERWGPVAAVRRLVWEGAFICIDLAAGTLWAGRDHLGIKPLYYARVGSGWAWASEIKTLVPWTEGDIIPIPPGSVARLPGESGNQPEFITWWRPGDQAECNGTSTSAEEVTGQVMELVRQAVIARVPGDRYAVALSGGVDSSLILRLAHEINANVTAYVLRRPSSPDLPYATSLCQALGVPLVEVQAPDPLEVQAAVPETVRSVESWEWHVVNHAAPMMTLSEAIRADGHRVVLAGEGADELFAGYGAVSAGQTPDQIRAERLARVSGLHRTNCRRLDRIGMRSTLEFRVPFLDRSLTEYALGLHPGWLVRDGTRKWILRATASRVLPPQIAWRAKLSFARGAGYQYPAGNAANSFSEPDRADQMPADWADLPRFPAERVFLRHFLSQGYGRASYLRTRSV